MSTPRFSNDKRGPVFAGHLIADQIILKFLLCAKKTDRNTNRDMQRGAESILKVITKVGKTFSQLWPLTFREKLLFDGAATALLLLPKEVVEEEERKHFFEKKLSRLLSKFFMLRNLDFKRFEDF